MALVFSNVGEILGLGYMLKDSSPEALTLKLYKNDYTPTTTSVAGDFTEADFTSYADKDLARASWATPTTVSNVASSAYAAQTFTCGTTGNTIYGYYYVGTTSGTLFAGERFATPRVLVSGDTLSVTPVITLSTT